MKVTYLNHSGFLLELEDCYIIFDYYRGELPLLNKEKEVFVFCSHVHADHYNPKVFSLLTCFLSCSLTHSHFPTLYAFQYKLHYIYCQRGTGNRQSALLHNGRGSCIGIAIFTKEYEKMIVEILGE